MAEANYNRALASARAFGTYSLVPYLGILFCPGALVMGSVGVLNSYRLPETGGRRGAYLSITVGALVMTVQLLLWWILYKVPEWNRR